MATVELFYRENGIVEGTIKGSTIKTIRFKREQQKELIEQIKQITGVYMLFSTDINNDDENKCVYIGKATELSKRLGQHDKNKEKDYWNETIVFTTTDNSFGDTEIRYLESRFVEIVKDAGRCICKNGNEPNIRKSK